MSKRCEDCKSVVQGRRAEHPRTRFCLRCARLRKRIPNSPSRLRSARNVGAPEFRTNHQERALAKPNVRMQNRAREASALEAIRNAILYITIIAVDLAGLIFIVAYSLKHLMSLLYR
jgi:hypothetical protein